MSRTSSFPYNSPNPLPALPGQEFQPFPPERLYDSREAAQYLRCKPRSIGKFINAGKLRASLVGRQFLISESNLKSFLEAQDSATK
jgi:excisionase family DNA binding protein